MSAHASVAAQQPETFAFTEENLTLAKGIIAKYPPGRQASAVMPLLDLAQRQHHNWLPRAAMDVVADMLGMPRIKVYEVATFYTMYNKAPVGEHFVQVCTNTPCWLRGSDRIVEAAEATLGVKLGETTADGKFTLAECECLGACVNAPVVQINDDYFEDLDADSTRTVLETLKKGGTVTPGSQTGRQGSCPAGGPTTLSAMAAKAGVAMAGAAGGDD